MSAQLAGSGSGPFSFLSLPMSARLNSLGGNNVSLADANISLALNNPALLTDKYHMVINTNFAYLMKNTFMADAMYGHNFKRMKNDKLTTNTPDERPNHFAIGIHYVNYGQMDYADLWGRRDQGTFSAHDMLINAIYSRQLFDRFNIGVALKCVYAAYERYSSFALGADIGMYYQIPDSSLQMGLTLQNICWQLKKFHPTNEPSTSLPLNLQFGLSYRVKHAPLRFSVTFHNMQRWNLAYEHTNVPISILRENPEYTKIKAIDMAFRHTIFSLDIVPKNNKFYLSLSYNHRRRAELNLKDQRSLAGFGLGAGLTLKKFNLDVAVSQLTKGNITIQFGLCLNLKSLL